MKDSNKGNVVDNSKLKEIAKSTGNEKLKTSINQKLKYVNKPISK